MRINKIKALRTREDIQYLKENQKVSIDKLLGVNRSKQKINRNQSISKTIDRQQFLDRYQIHNVSLSTLSKSWYQNIRTQSLDNTQHTDIPKKTLTSYKDSILCELKEKIVQQSLSPNKSIEKDNFSISKAKNYKTLNHHVYKQLYKTSMNNQFNFNKSKKELQRWKQELFFIKKTQQHPSFLTCQNKNNQLVRLPRVEDFHMNLTKNIKNKQIFHKKAKRLHNPEAIKRNSYSPWHSFGETKDGWNYKIAQKPEG